MSWDTFVARLLEWFKNVFIGAKNTDEKPVSEVIRKIVFPGRGALKLITSKYLRTWCWEPERQLADKIYVVLSVIEGVQRISIEKHYYTHSVEVISISRYSRPDKTYPIKLLFSKQYDFIGYGNNTSDTNKNAILVIDRFVSIFKYRTVDTINFAYEIEKERRVVLGLLPPDKTQFKNILMILTLFSPGLLQGVQKYFWITTR